MKTDFTNEELLKKALKSGSGEAFTFLMDTYHHPLCLYVNTMCKDYDLAKDLVQNVFVKLWEYRENIDDISSLKSFLYRLAHNEFVSQYRKDQKLSLFKMAHIQVLDEIVQDDEELLKKQIELIKREIDKLPDRCKETFLLSKEEGLTHTEIAEYMGVTTKTVEMQITRAFRVLRKNLKGKVNPLLFLLFGMD